MKNEDISKINDFTKLKVQPNLWAKIRGTIVFFFFLLKCRFNVADAMMRSMRYYQRKIEKQHNKWKRDNKEIYDAPGRETIIPKKEESK